MENYKYLTIGWSFVWGLCMLSMVNLNVKGTMSLVAIPLVKENFISFVDLLWVIPVYAFIVWALGVVMISLLVKVVDWVWIK